MKIVRPNDIAKILAVTDALRIHREAVRVPLAPLGAGPVRIDRSALVIEAPEDGSLDTFLDSLPDRIRALPGVGQLKPA